MPLSPGLRLLLPRFAGVISPPRRCIQIQFKVPYLAFAVLPVLVVLRICATRLYQHTRARKLGARLIPVPRDGQHLAWATTTYILTTEPEYIKIVLATDFANYEKGCMDSVLGTGVFNSDGEMWKFHRAATRPFFNRNRISDFDTFAHHADRAVERMKERFRAGHAVDFQDLASRFTMDSATSFLFGSCVDSLDATPLPYAHNTVAVSEQTSDAFSAAYNSVIEQTSSRTRWGDVWPLFEMQRDATREPMRIVDAYLEPIIAAAVQAQGGCCQKAETLLDELLNQTSDPKVLKDEVLNILLAGRDTTMSVLTLVVYLLVLKRLRSEIISHVGVDRRPTYDDIREMKYLRAVLNETMRLYPPVPSNLRECLKETTWPSTDPSQPPLYIAAGSKICYSVFLMHRRKDLWGPEAEDFDPDRFLDERLRKVHRSLIRIVSFRSMPGPRVCLGQQLDEDACPPESRVPIFWRTGEGRMTVERFKARLHLSEFCAGGLWVRMSENNVLD
ncbi:cytochrome P450 monooxygenase pc-3 [Mycena amicta]|nr:cytochrome P450 monooxygenase pc-3 [Mycena amicta]